MDKETEQELELLRHFHRCWATFHTIATSNRVISLSKADTSILRARQKHAAQRLNDAAMALEQFATGPQAA